MFEMREFIRGIEWDKIEEVFGVGFCGRMQSRMIERFLQVGESPSMWTGFRYYETWGPVVTLPASQPGQFKEQFLRHRATAPYDIPNEWPARTADKQIFEELEKFRKSLQNAMSIKNPREAIIRGLSTNNIGLDDR